MADPMGPWRGVLLLAGRPGTALYVGPGGPADLHAHHAVQLAIGLDAPVEVRCGDAPQFTARAVVVPGGIPHEFTTRGDVAMFYADPSSAIGRQLGRLTPSQLPGAARETPPEPPADLARSRPARYLEQLLGLLGIADAVDQHLSPRLASVVSYVEEQIRDLGKVSLADAARHAVISPSRLTQTFTR